MTLIIGANGSMGVRYQAILKSLKESFVTTDIQDGFNEIINFAKAKNIKRIILCTPTETHGKFLRKLIPISKPILCEKPVVKDTYELDHLFDLVEKHNTHFTMMYQYSELVSLRKIGPSFYNYFRTGKDGLIWDCLQIIGLANDTIDLKNDSPVWKCTINGTALKSSDMDYAYLTFVKKWLKNKQNQNLSELYRIHQKVEEIFNASH